MNFHKEKIEFLEKRDKSRKGNIDVKINNLVNKINSNENFYTTSSCSGRILILEYHSSERKDKLKWLFSSHDKISFNNLKNIIIKLPKNDVWFRFDPAILHITVNNIDNAIKLLNIARDIGFRRSGIISIKKNKIIMELISTERIITLISKNKKLLVDENYLKILIKEGNKKLENTWKKIDKLNVIFSKE